LSDSEFQAVLLRLYASPPFLGLYVRDPETALSGYDISEAERQALRNIGTGKLCEFADGLAKKRIRRIKSAYPVTWHLAPDKCERYARRFHEMCIPASCAMPWDDVISAGAFFSDTLAADEDIPPYVHEVAVFERLRLEVSCWQGVANAEPQPHARPDYLEPGVNRGPRLADGVRFRRFEFDVAEICADPSAWKSTECVPDLGFAIVPAYAEGVPRAIRVSGPAVAVVEAADSRASADEVVQRLNQVGDHETPSERFQIINQLMGLGILCA
jgi:hypothetical protein